MSSSSTILKSIVAALAVLVPVSAAVADNTRPPGFENSENLAITVTNDMTGESLTVSCSGAASAATIAAGSSSSLACQDPEGSIDVSYSSSVSGASGSLTMTCTTSSANLAFTGSGSSTTYSWGCS